MNFRSSFKVILLKIYKDWLKRLLNFCFNNVLNYGVFGFYVYNFIFNRIVYLYIECIY